MAARTIKRILFVALLCSLTSESLDARFLWPWEQRRVVVVRPRSKIIIPRNNPDCESILEAIDVLDKDRLERTLKRFTKAQRKIVEECKRKRG